MLEISGLPSSFYFRHSSFVLFHTPTCKKCGTRFYLARLPVLLNDAASELLEIVGRRSYGSVIDIFYYRCPSCGSVASISDCYYAMHRKKLEKEQKRGRDYRPKDLFYAGLKGRLRQKERGMEVPELASKIANKDWHLFVRCFMLFFVFLFALMGGLAIFMLWNAKSAGVL